MRILVVLALAPLSLSPPQERIEIDQQPPLDFLRRWTAAEDRKDWKQLLDLHTFARERHARRLCLPGFSVKAGAPAGEPSPIPAPADARWVPLHRELSRRLAAMPEDERRRYEALCRELLESAPDRAARLRVIEDYAWTLAAHHARVALANEDFDAGRLLDALRGWTIEFEARASPALAARIAHARALSGDALALAALRTQVDALGFDGGLVVAGRPRAVPDYLDSIALSRREPDAPEPRILALPRPIAAPTNEIALGSYDFRLDGGTFSRAAATSLPAYARHDGKEYAVITNGVRVTAIDPGRGDGGTLEDDVYWKFPSEEGVRSIPSPSSSGPLPQLGAAAEGRRVFVTMFSVRSRARLTGRYPDRFDGPAAIRAFDLHTGKLLWDTDDIEVGPPGQRAPLMESLPFSQRNFCFSGPPIARGDRVLAAVMTSPNADRECYVLCLNAADGKPRWVTYIGYVPRRQTAASVATFAEEGGTIVVQSGFGWVVALSTETGHIEWLVRHESLSSRTVTSPPFFHRGQVILFPQDREQPLLLDRLTGREAPFPAAAAAIPWWRVLQLVGVVDDWMVLTGPTSWALRLTDGRAVELVDCDASAGWRGAIADSRVYIPTARGLRVYDPATWRLVEGAAWNAEGDGGNLLVAESLCLFAGERLCVTTSPAWLEARLGPRAQASPPRASVVRQMGRILETSGRLREAMKYYRLALRALEGDPAWAETVEVLRAKVKGLGEKLGDPRDY